MSTAYNFAVTGTYRDSGGTAVPVKFYSRHVAPNSDPALRVPVSPYLSQPLEFEQWMFGSRQTRGIREPGGGAFICDNSTGVFDSLRGVAFDGNTFLVVLSKHQNREYVSGSYSTFMTLVADNAEVTESRLSVLVRDMTFYIKKPALTVKYGGTNALPAGVDGTPTDIKGMNKPKVYGTVKNFQPPCVNTSKLIYQVDVNGFRTGWTIAVRDQYVALAAGANYASQADMEATAPAAGQYRVWVAGGMFRLNAAVGVVTCDVSNPVSYTIPDDAPNPTTGNELHILLRKVAQDGGLPGAVFMDATRYSASAIPVGGIVITGDMTYLDACNQLAASINCYWYLDGSTIFMVPLKDVSAASPTFTLDEAAGHFLSQLRRVPTGDSDRGKPLWRVTVQYAKNHRVMSDSEVAGAVSQADRAYVKREYLEVYAENTAVKTEWPKAPELVVQSLMTVAADAQAEADRLLDRFEVNRDCFEAEVPMQLLFDTSGTIALGDVVTIKHRRFGMSAGEKFQIIGRKIDILGGKVLLTLWG